MEHRTFRRILVGWDGSPSAETALCAAADLAAGPGGHVVALAVLATPRHTEADEEGAQQLTTHRRHVEERFERLLGRLTVSGDTRLTLQLTEGRRIADALAHYAADHGFDLIVVGRQGGGGTLHPSQVPRELAQITPVSLLIV
ncbi:universal stress protein [Actinoallomurus acaciae]|uniref:Universal stress protein n=1 Tax=Actinoallomurus acaciae TaxID=502577 RepID=A0ABV5YG51_9ACTN